MKKPLAPRVRPLLVAAMLAIAPLAQATDVLRTPLPTDGAAKPNVVFGMDDSGSMDFEVLLNTSDGKLWWETSVKDAWRDGQPLFSGNDSKPLAYLFPNGCGDATRHVCDSNSHWPVPPTPKFASMRSSAFNPLYYDPATTYRPWPTATVAGKSVSFGNANPKAALSHPLYATPAMDLTALQNSTSSNMYYTMFAGMVIPKGARMYDGRSWATLTGDYTVRSGQVEYAAIEYYPATYYMPEDCGTVNNTTCVAAPDGRKLKRYEIKSGNTFPSGRSYADELQNFANWFQYYRKRKLMLAGSMGVVLNSLTGMRLGVVNFNDRQPVTMYDTDNPDALLNGKAIAGQFYGNGAEGGTPTRETLNYIGAQFTSNKNIVQHSCQRNAAFIVTDGFANVTNVAPPAYDKKTYGNTAPYTITYNGTLADIALSYYTNNIRPDLAAGRVPAATESLDPSADKNKNLHVNTYGITLGARGYLWPANTNPYKSPPSWPNPNTQQSPMSIDDLWHATINGRGAMFIATTPQETADNIQDALTQILRLSGSQSGVTYSTVNLKAGNSFAYAGSYKPVGWSGDIESFEVDPLTGTLAVKPLWSANKKLEALDWTQRKVATFDTSARSGAALDGTFFSGNQPLTDYLRGDRSREETDFRMRTGLIGAVINAEPVVSAADGVVFAATNEGMLHAFDMGTGNELWAHVPSFARAEMVAQSARGATFRTILDGTPVLGKAGDRKILVGGAGTAGPGYYALDVTSPKTADTESAVAARALWEFPNATTPGDVRSAVGTSIGRPVIVKTRKHGTVVLVTSGYNSTLDGKGRLFLLDALTGDLKYTFVTSEGTLGAGDAGLGQVSGYQEADGTVRFVYGGDELGNVWRFDIESSTIFRLAVLKDKAGKTLPVTAAPELFNNSGRRMVLVGTGRLLGEADLGDNRVNTFFGLWDNNTEITDVRTQLAEQKVTVDGAIRRSTGPQVNWQTQRGWRMDLPAGEKANTDPAVAYGMVAFTINKPSPNSCSASSALYLVDAASGSQLTATAFITGTPYVGMEFGSTLASRPSLARTASGRIVVTARQSDGTTNSRLLNLGGTVPPHKNSWREILR